MSRFLIDENVNQVAVRSVPTEGKGFDVLYPQYGGYAGANDTAILELAEVEQRVLVSQEKDFGKFGLEPEDIPHGAIWLRPGRLSQTQVEKLWAGLCKVLVENFPLDPYNFSGKIVEVHQDRVVIRTAAGSNSYPVSPASPN